MRTRCRVDKEISFDRGKRNEKVREESIQVRDMPGKRG